MSTPGLVRSGYLLPHSITNIASSVSMQYKFLPFSSKPPRAKTRTTGTEFDELEIILNLALY